MPDKESGQDKAEWLFDGSHPEEYRKWRRWVQSKLIQGSTGERPKLPRRVCGVTVFGWVRGAALDLL